MEGALRPDGQRWSAIALTMAAVLALAAEPACGKSRRHSEAADVPADPGPAAPATAAAEPGRRSSARPEGPTGTIKGTVKLVGTPPEMPPLQRGSDGFCATKEMRAEVVVVGAGGGLQNTVVRIEPGAVPGWVPSEPVVIDQVDCMYRPRVQAGVRGQTLEVRNSDGTAHNVNARRLAWGERREAESIFNRGQPAGAAPLTGPIRGDDILKVTCDSHGWMQGYVVVSDNPYAAATGPDGSFAIEQAPAGSYTLQSWHEYYGIKTLKITVA